MVSPAVASGCEVVTPRVLVVARLVVVLVVVDPVVVLVVPTVVSEPQAETKQSSEIATVTPAVRARLCMSRGYVMSGG
jgi:hypothetical protein